MEHLGEEWKEEDAKMISKQTGLTAGRGSAWEQGDDCCVLTLLTLSQLQLLSAVNTMQSDTVFPLVFHIFNNFLGFLM